MQTGATFETWYIFSRAIGNMIFVLVWPIIPWLLQIAFVAYYVISAAYVGSMGSAEYYNNATNTTDDGGVSYYLKRAPCDVNVSNNQPFIIIASEAYSVRSFRTVHLLKLCKMKFSTILPIQFISP